MIRTASENETEGTGEHDSPAKQNEKKDRVLLCGRPIKSILLT